MKFVLSSVWSQCVFFTIFAVVLRLPSWVPIKSVWFMHQKPPLFAQSFSHLPLPLWSVKLDMKIKLQELCASVSAVWILFLPPVAGNDITFTLFWSEPSYLMFPHVSVELSLEEASPSVSEDFRSGRDDRLDWSWGFDTRPLSQASMPFRQIIITPPAVFAVGGSSMAADMHWWPERGSVTQFTIRGRRCGGSFSG